MSKSYTYQTLGFYKLEYEKIVKEFSAKVNKRSKWLYDFIQMFGIKAIS